MLRAFFVGTGFVLIYLVLSHVPTVFGQADAKPDLTIESIVVNPPNPGAGQQADILVTVKNIGNAAATGFRVHLYVAPTDEPPTVNTPSTSTTFFGTGLGIGKTTEWKRTNHTFTAANQKIYAWVDRDNQVVESNENNNLYPNASSNSDRDSYEDDDNCAAAKPITSDGIAQQHNLFREPDADEDWVSFVAVGGVTYHAIAAAVGADADLYIELHAGCSDPPGLGSGAEITFTAPANGTYYLKVGHNLPDSYGPQTDYLLSIEGDSACAGNYEPNDICSLAGDLAVNGVAQQHSFCQNADVDWVRLEVVAGAQYRASATNTGNKADAQLGLYPDCEGAPSLDSSQQIEFTAPSSGYVYLRSANLDPAQFGAGAEYNLKVEQLNSECSGDAAEPDDGQATAKELTANAPAQTHRICPAGEQDWVKWQAVAGQSYEIETLNLAKDADTVVCLYDANGAQISCDDDSGAGLGSRLLLQNVPSNAVYYASVRHYKADVAGPNTQYDLRLSTSLCAADAFEDDGSQTHAKAISPNGAAQAHNFCPEADTDWLSFTASPGSYLIETSDLGSEADTVLELYDASGTLLASNDDYDSGLASRIAYNFSSAQPYFVRVYSYNPKRYGTDANYSLRITGSSNPTPTATPSPSPTPTQTPPPTATPVPPTTQVKTLILVNPSRLASLYNQNAVDQLMAKLGQLAQHSEVQGQIIRLDQNNEVSAAYTSWQANLTSVNHANQVATAIRNVILTYLHDHSGVEYVLLVGDDQALPFRRVRDYTAQPENTYSEVDANHPTGAALHQNYYLTDDYFVDREPTANAGREIYIPDLVVGRLIESPSDMIGLIDQFLADSTLDSYNALITGYDFVDDAAAEMCTDWQRDAPANVDCSLISQNWDVLNLQNQQLSANPSFKVQSISGHANHAVEGAPNDGYILGSDIATSSSDLAGGLIYTLGCHAGLNVPASNSIQPLDLAEAFARKRANYIGNTGFGWGISGAVGLSERLMTLFTGELLKGEQTPMGAALIKAKQNYYLETQSLDAYGEKVMQQLIFYGLPMTKVVSGLALDGEEFPGVSITGQQVAASASLSVKTLNIDFQEALANYTTEKTTSDGSYLALADHTFTTAGAPIQPLFFANLADTQSAARGVVIRSATFTTRSNFNPVIAAPYNEYVTERSEGTLDRSDAWIPALPVTLQSQAGRTNLVSQLGAYNPATSQLRLYRKLQVDLYQSTSSDQSVPQIQTVDGVVVGGTVFVKVDAEDLSGIGEVVVSYLETNAQGTSTIRSINLRFDGGSHKWLGSFAGTAQTRYFVQVVDSVGNVASATNKGQYYNPVATNRTPLATNRSIYLPMVQR